MGIQEIDLRRSDFEAMHPVARLFNFDHEKLTYFGDAYDDAKRLNDLWSTWCACVGLLYLETNTAKAQAVPEGFILIKNDTKTVVAIERMVEQQVEASGMDSRRLERLDGWRIIEAAIEAQEPTND